MLDSRFSPQVTQKEDNGRAIGLCWKNELKAWSQTKDKDNFVTHFLQSKINHIFEIIFWFTCFKPRRSLDVFSWNLHEFHIDQSVTEQLLQPAAIN